MSHSLSCEGPLYDPTLNPHLHPSWSLWTKQVTLLVFVRQMFLWFASVHSHITECSDTNALFSKSLILVNYVFFYFKPRVFFVLCCVDLEPFLDIRGEFVLTAFTRKNLLSAMYMVLSLFPISGQNSKLPHPKKGLKQRNVPYLSFYF